MKTILAAAVLGFFLAATADLIPPNVHSVNQTGMVENRDTLSDYSCVLENWCAYTSDFLCGGPFTILQDSLFALRGHWTQSVNNQVRIFKPAIPDTQSFFLYVGSQYLPDSDPITGLEYHYRFYYGSPGKICLATVGLITTFNNGAPPDTQRFPLPEAVEKAKNHGTGFPVLSVDPLFITFKLARPQPVSIQITDIRGRAIKTLSFARSSVGRIPFPKVAAGAYLVKLESLEGSVSQQVMILK
jgi:hypothetical protein